MTHPGGFVQTWKADNAILTHPDKVELIDAVLVNTDPVYIDCMITLPRHTCDQMILYKNQTQEELAA